MKMEEIFKDAHESFSDEVYLSDACLNNCATHTKKICEVDVRQESVAASTEGENLETENSCRNAQVSSGRNTRKEYILKQITGEHTYPNYVSSIDCEELADNSCCTTEKTRNLDYVMVGAPLNVICRTLISFKDSTKSRTSMEFLFGSSETQKLGSKVSNELDKFSVQHLSMHGLESGYVFQKGATISPVGQLAVHAINGSGKISSILRSSLFVQLADQVKSMVSDRSRSIESREARCSDSDSSYDEHCSTSSHAQSMEPVRKHRYGSDFTRETFSNDVLSHSRSITTDSSQFSLPSRSTLSKGVLQFFWEGGIPHFIFSLDDQERIYVAEPQRIESSEDKSLDWVYLFSTKIGDHSKKIDDVRSVSDVVGKMKVSSTLSIDCDSPTQFKSVETEYVLFGVSEELERGRAWVNPVVRKAKGVQKMVPNIFRSPHSRSHSIDTKVTQHVSSSKGPFCVDFPGAQENSAKSRTDYSVMDLMVPNLQLVAMVVKGCIDQKSCQKSTIGGWGLKFLKGAADSNLSCNVSDHVLTNTGKPTVDMTVLVAEDFHGGPLTQDGGPLSLIERWRSGGRCDCGGWDIGCPLKILDNRSKNTSGDHVEYMEECKSFSLFVQGNKQYSPVLKMVNIHEGMYFVHFQSILSALQSFSIGVAIIHSQSPSLFSKMYDT